MRHVGWVSEGECNDCSSLVLWQALIVRTSSSDACGDVKPNVVLHLQKRPWDKLEASTGPSSSQGRQSPLHHKKCAVLRTRSWLAQQRQHAGENYEAEASQLRWGERWDGNWLERRSAPQSSANARSKALLDDGLSLQHHTGNLARWRNIPQLWDCDLTDYVREMLFASSATFWHDAFRCFQEPGRPSLTRQTHPNVSSTLEGHNTTWLKARSLINTRDVHAWDWVVFSMFPLLSRTTSPCQVEVDWLGVWPTAICAVARERTVAIAFHETSGSHFLTCHSHVAKSWPMWTQCTQ